LNFYVNVILHDDTFVLADYISFFNEYMKICNKNNGYQNDMEEFRLFNDKELKIIFEKVSYEYSDFKKLEKELDGQTNKKIAVIQKRSPGLIFSLISLMNKGCTFIPIDPSLPQERKEFIIQNAKPDFILQEDGLKPNYFTGSTDFIQGVSDNISYIIYTSGSTGQPKGVAVTRDALFNFIEGISEIIDFSAGKRIACLTTISFDIFLLESIMALYKGLTVVLANEDEQRNPKLMAKLIQDNAVDMIQMTPSRMQLLLNYDKELMCLKNVKEIMIGGEPFPISLLRSLQEKTTAKIYNMYGPTETTIWSTVSNLTCKDRVDIGRPIKNTEIYIVDENLFILPYGQAGEICIAGKGLSKGYVGREDLTREKFIYLPQKPEVMVYRTGDIGRYLPDGDLEYLGRTDNQVKIRGYRIELEEIEFYMNQIEGINQSIVIAIEKSEPEKILQAFYTSDIALEQKDISNYLSSKLPEYMIPVIFKRVESFIQTANGKIDRKRVLECVEIKNSDSIPEDSNISELNDNQKKALEVIISNLDSKIAGDITLEAEFAGAGIDSVTFIKIVLALENEFDFEFDDEMLLITNFPKVRTLVEYVELKTSTNK